MRFVRALLCAVALACALGGSASAGSLPGQSPPLPATHTLNGLMSAADKIKIDGLVTPTLGTDLLRLEDVAVGNCAIQSSGTGGGASFSCITPLTLADYFAIVSNTLTLKFDTTKIHDVGGVLTVVSAPPSGAALGDLGGTFPGPTVLAAEFGAQRLTFATTADGSLLKRSGTTVAPAVSGTDYVVTVRADGIATGTVQLASVSAANMIEGAVAYVSSVGDYFSLVQSALTTDAITVVAASGKSGYQWVRLGIPNQNFFAVTTWWVDPVSGSDEATGLSSGTGLKTYAELSRRLNGRNTRTSITVNMVNDATDTDFLSLNFAPTAGTAVSILGIETQLATGTVASFTVPNFGIGGNTLNQVTVSGFNWAPWVGFMVRKHGASNGTGIYASVLADLGGGSALLAPTSLTGSPSFASYFQTGDIVEVVGYTKAPQIMTENTPTLFIKLASLLRTTGQYGLTMHGVNTSAIVNFSTIGVGSTFSANFQCQSFSSQTVATNGSITIPHNVSLTNVSLTGTAFYSFGAVAGSVSLSDSVLYPTAPSTTSPLISMAANASVSLSSRASPGIGVGIFNLAAGSVGIALGTNSFLTASNIFGANNNANSWILAYPSGTKVNLQRSLQSSYYEASSAGIKTDWISNANINSGSTISNIVAGWGPEILDRYQAGRGPVVASASRLIPQGLLSYREWNVTGTSTINTITQFSEVNGVTLLNDGLLVELDIQDGLTITNNGTNTPFVDAKVFLAGGTNAVLPAGSHILLRWNASYATGSGVWNEVSRDSSPALSVQGNSGNSPAITQPIVSGGGSRYLGSNSGNTAAGFVQIIESDILNLVADLAARVPTSRTLSVTAPGTIDGGGSADLSANRTIAFPVFGASGPGHHAGLVPDPGSSAGTTRFVREDGTLAVPPGTAGSGITAGTGPVTFAGSGSVATNINLGAGGIGGALPLPDVAAPSGTGFPHVTGSTWDSSAAALDATLVFSTTLGRAAISGDGTISAGSNVFNLNNIPNDTALPGDFLASNSAAPGAPVTGKTRCWVDSTTFMFTCLNASGAKANLVQANTGVTHYFVNGISPAGVISLGQPVEADVFGLVADIAAKQNIITATGILLGLGGGSVISALPGVDYQAPGNYITDLTGDGSAHGPGSVPFTLANTGVTANTYGGAGKYIQSVQVDAKGRVLANPVVVSGAQAVVWKWFARGEFLNYDPTNKSDAFAMADGDSVRWAGTGVSVLALTVLNSDTTNSAPYYTNNVTPDTNGTFQAYLGYANGVGGGSASLKVDLFAIHGSPGNSSNYTDLATCTISPTQAAGDNIGSCSSSIGTGFSAGDLFAVIVSRADTNPSLSLNNISITATASISQ